MFLIFPIFRRRSLCALQLANATRSHQTARQAGRQAGGQAAVHPFRYAPLTLQRVLEISRQDFFLHGPSGEHRQRRACSGAVQNKVVQAIVHAAEAF